MVKLYASKTFPKMAGGRMHTPHATPLDPPLAITTKASKESGIFKSLGTINYIFFTKRQGQKGSPRHNGPPPKYALASADVLFFTDIRRGAVEKKIGFGLIHVKSVCYRKYPLASQNGLAGCTLPTPGLLHIFG